MKRLKFALIATLSAFSMVPSIADDVVIKADHIEITATDLTNYVLDRVPENGRDQFFREGNAINQLVESLLTIRILAAEAAETGLFDTELIEWQVAMHRERLMMEQYLDALVKSHTDGINWEATAREAYLANPDAYGEPEQVTASHVLISTEDRSDDEALARAKEVREKLVAGTDIKSLAEEYSDDPSAKTNLGVLGIITKGQTVPEFEKAVFSLSKPGEIAEPVKTQFGYHVILLEQYTPARQREFDDVKSEIIANLKQQIPSKIRQDKVIEARSVKDVEIDKEQLDALLEKFRAGDFE